MQTQVLLFVILAPALTAGVLLLAAHRLYGKSPALQALACGAGYGAGHVGLLGMPAGFPAEATQWLLPLALASVLPVLWERMLGKRRLPILVLRFLASAGVAYLLYQPLLTYSFSRLVGMAWVAGSAFAVTLIWSAFVAAERRMSAVLPLLLLALLSATASGGILLSRSASVAMLAGVLTSVLGAAAVVSYISGKTALPGVIPFAALLYASHLAIGYHYAEMKTLVFLLFLAVPAAAAVAVAGKPDSAARDGLDG